MATTNPQALSAAEALFNQHYQEIQAAKQKTGDWEKAFQMVTGQPWPAGQHLTIDAQGAHAVKDSSKLGKIAKVASIAAPLAATVFTGGAASPWLAASLGAGTGALSGAANGGGWKGALTGAGMGAATGMAGAKLGGLMNKVPGVGKIPPMMSLNGGGGSNPSVINSLIGGAEKGALGSALHGGDLHDILTGAGMGAGMNAGTSMLGNRFSFADSPSDSNLGNFSGGLDDAGNPIADNSGPEDSSYIGSEVNGVANKASGSMLDQLLAQAKDQMPMGHITTDPNATSQNQHWYDKLLGGASKVVGSTDAQGWGDLGKVIGSYGQAEAQNRQARGNFMQDYDKLNLDYDKQNLARESDAMKKLNQTGYLLSGGHPYQAPKLNSGQTVDLGYGPKAPSAAQMQGAGTLQDQLLARLTAQGALKPTDPNTYTQESTGEKIAKYGGLAAGGLGAAKTIWG